MNVFGSNDGTLDHGEDVARVAGSATMAAPRPTTRMRLLRDGLHAGVNGQINVVARHGRALDLECRPR